jgi:hypothetical protein
MSKMTVKVKTSTLIKALEKALDERHTRMANQEKEQSKYEKAHKEYLDKLFKIVKSGKADVTDLSPDNWYARNNPKSKDIRFSAVIVMPKSLAPAMPEQVVEYAEWQHKRETEEISQAIRLLNMTDQEYVPASTYKSVSQYL